MTQISLKSDLVISNSGQYPKSGDCVIIVILSNELRAVYLKTDEVFQTRFGALRHNDCIAKPYGSKINTSRGFVHMLALDPVLWSAALPHRTQIIYPTDAALIVGGLDLVPGRRVLESGTGSGSLTHFLANAVQPHGWVGSFDFHQLRVDKAKEEFELHSLSHVVSVNCRDTLTDGFPPIGDPLNPHGVDAVFLDLPRPWLIVGPKLVQVYDPLKGGRFCSFSPCIEQVQRTCQALRETGFSQLQTFECLDRVYNVARARLNVPNMGQLSSVAQELLQTDNELAEKRRRKIDADQFEKLERCALLPPPSLERSRINSNKRKRRASSNNNDTPSLSVAPANSFTWEVLPQALDDANYLSFAQTGRPSNNLHFDVIGLRVEQPATKPSPAQ